MLKIETIKNGWTVEDMSGNTEAFLDIRDLLNHLLLVLQGKSEHFGGSMYGKVIVDLKEKP